MSRKNRALIRTAPLSRVAVALGAVMASFLVLGVSLGLAGTTLLWFPCAIATVTGLLWNAVRNQGAWLLDHTLVLEAVVGRAVIRLGDIVEVHIDEAMTTLGVQTSTHYVVQSIVTAANLGVREGARDRTIRLLQDQSIRCVWHAGLAEVYGVATSTSPFMWPGAVLGTLRRPLVWGSALAGMGYGVLLIWTGGA